MSQPGVQQYPDEAFMNAVRQYDPPVASAGEVRAEVGCSRNTFNNRMTGLEAKGDLVARPAPDTTIWIDAEYARNGGNGASEEGER